MVFSTMATADLDVAEQRAFQGVFEAGGPGQFADLADVVQDDAGEDQVAHEHGVVRHDAVGEADEADHMLQQAAEPGMMELLGGGSLDEGFADGGVGQDGGDQPLQIGIGEAGYGCFEFLPELGDVVGGGGQQIGSVELGAQTSCAGARS